MWGWAGNYPIPPTSRAKKRTASGARETTSARKASRVSLQSSAISSRTSSGSATTRASKRRTAGSSRARAGITIGRATTGFRGICVAASARCNARAHGSKRTAGSGPISSSGGNSCPASARSVTSKWCGTSKICSASRARGGKRPSNVLQKRVAGAQQGKLAARRASPTHQQQRSRSPLPRLTSPSTKPRSDKRTRSLRSTTLGSAQSCKHGRRKNRRRRVQSPRGCDETIDVTLIDHWDRVTAWLEAARAGRGASPTVGHRTTERV